MYNEFIQGNGFLQRWYETLYKQKGFTLDALEINGKDIINMGITEGPRIGQIKKELFAKVCNGYLINRRDRLLEEMKKYAED